MVAKTTNFAILSSKESLLIPLFSLGTYTKLFNYQDSSKTTYFISSILKISIYSYNFFLNIGVLL